MAETLLYYFDPATAQYKRAEPRKADKIIYISKVAVLAFGIAVSMVIGYSSFFELPSEVALKKEIKVLESDFKKLDTELIALQQVVGDVEQRDDNVYRAVLGAEPLDQAIRNGGIGGAERYSELRDQKIKYGEFIESLETKVSKIKRKVYIELLSQDELLNLAEEKRKQFAAIPAIQPLANKDLTALASGFGMRLHPVYKVIKMHTGIDFSSPVGTPVYATAEGQVIAVDTAVRGYGKMVIIDHGYGYQTRYGHLQSFKVKVGDHVKRGVAIAWSGNTGVSTAPHLHYEVLLNGVQINPVHYFVNDLSPVEYEKIVALASVQNQSLGN